MAVPLLAASADEPLNKQRERARQEFLQGHYQKAFETYRSLTINKANDPTKIADDLTQAIDCLNRLGRVNEADVYLEEVIAINQENWRVLGKAAELIHSLGHEGYIIAGKFERGFHRGGGRYVESTERDRVRSLQLFEAARKLLPKKEAVSEVYALLLAYADVVSYEGQPGEVWKLQHLTELEKLPDFEDPAHAGLQAAGAPVGPDGLPIYYSLPSSFTQANNDGERFRFLLEEAKRTLLNNREPEYIFAKFLLGQFGVQTLGQLVYPLRGEEDDLSRTRDATFALHTLDDHETIARLATGVKRFRLPDEFNPILILKSLADQKALSHQQTAIHELAQIYANRRQFEKAASYWKLSISRFGENAQAREELDNIVGARGRFENVNAQAARNSAKVQYRFRNGNSLHLEAYEIKVEELLGDVKTYLESNPARLDYEKVNIENIGYRLVQKNQTKYLGKRVRTWNEVLDPLSGHFDRRVTIDTELRDPGAYLLEGRIAGGNSSKIILWLNDTIIIQKRVDQGSFYFLADANSGAPLKDVELEFFGYRVDQIPLPDFVTKPLGRTQNISTTKFSKRSDAAGTVIVERSLLEASGSSYQWLITARPGGHLVYGGFHSVWGGTWHDQEYNQLKYYVITDRPVYRPGQQVKLKIWMRHARYDLEDGREVADRPLTIQVKDPRAEKLLEEQLTTDKYGGVHSELTLPADSALGTFQICVKENANYCRNIGSFRVEEYKKPEFEVNIDAPSEPTKLGDVITATVRAEYYFGEPVQSARVKYRVNRYEHDARWYPRAPWDWLYGGGYWWFAYDYTWYPGFREWGCFAPFPFWAHRPTPPPELVVENEVAIGRDGTVPISIDTQLAKELHGNSDHRYEIDVEVTDQSRRTIYGNGKVLVARAPFKVYAWLDRGHYSTDEVIQARFSAHTLDQKPVKGEGVVRLFAIRYDQAGAPTETEIEKWQLDPNDEGTAELQLKAQAAGQYRISYSVTDEKRHTIEGAYIFTVRGEGTEREAFRFNELEVIPDKREYAPGENVKLQLNTAQANSNVLLFVRALNGVYLKPELLALRGKTTTREIPVEKRDMPNFFVEAVTVSNGQVYTEVREIVVPPEKRVLDLKVLPEKTEYQAGEKAKVKVLVTDFFGKPFVGSVVMSVYDKSVEYISGGSNVPEIKEFFWKWRRRHSPTGFTNALRHSVPLYPPGEKTMRSIGAFGSTIGNDEGISEDETLGAVAGLGGAALDGAHLPQFRMQASRSKGVPTELEPAEAVPIPAAAGSNAPDQVTVRREFADSAYWAAQIITDKEGMAELEFPLPENLTGWKIRSWALGSKTEVGEGAAEIVTKKNLLLRLQAPRFFVERDEVVLSANVHNYLPTEKKVKVLIELEGETLALQNAAEQEVLISTNGERRVDFRVAAINEGTALVRMKALSDEESDAMEMQFPVQVHGMLKTESFSGALPSEADNQSFKITVPGERRVAETRFELRYSPTLAGAMVDALPYLVAYPYGCTEQTLNRFLPTVITQRVLRAMNLDLEAIRKKRTNLNAQELGSGTERAKQWKRYADDPVYDEAEVKRMAKTGLHRLISMQLEDGGWGWFSGWGERSTAHTTAQVVRGLQIARANDLEFASDALNAGLSWLRNYEAEQLQRIKNTPTKTQPWKEHPDDLDSFVFSVLVENGTPNVEMKELLFRDRTKLSVYGNALLALALLRAGDDEKRKVVQQSIEQYLVEDAENQTAYLRLPSEGYWWFWYGSEIETHATYLKLLARVEPTSKKAAGIVKYLLNNRKHSTYWNSTRDTALVVEAFAEYLKGSKELEPNLTIEVFLDGAKKKEVKVSPENLFTFDNVLLLEGEEVASGTHTIEIRKQGNGPLYYNAYLTNFTLEDFITKAGLEIKVERKYYKLVREEAETLVPGERGQAIREQAEKYKRIPITNMGEVTSGDRIEIELEIESKNDYEYLVFEDMKAAGLEPIELRSGYTRNDLGAYVEFRDNRVVFFVRSLARGKHSVSYRMNAEIPGSFSALPTNAYAMYAPELRANSDELKLEVLDRP